jgi:integron integrase
VADRTTGKNPKTRNGMIQECIKRAEASQAANNSVAAIDPLLQKHGIPKQNRPFYRLWIRQYLDFCDATGLPPADTSSIPLFLSDIGQRVQEPWRREQAEKAVRLFLEVCQPSSNRLQIEPEKPEKAIATIVDNPWDKAIASLGNAITLKHYSRSTLRNYTSWVRRFRAFIKEKDPKLIRSSDARMYLEHLAVKGRISAKTQNLAFNSLLFLYKNVLNIPFDNMAGTLRARQGSRLPEVLSVDEVKAVLAAFDGIYRLIAELMYGCGLRLNEALSLRIQDIDVQGKKLTVRGGKGNKDRTLPLPEKSIATIEMQVNRNRALCNWDKKDEAYAGVFLPDSTERQNPEAALDFGFYWLFPARELTDIPGDFAKRRYHIHATVFQRQMQDAVRKAGINRRATAHTLRHSFATHLLQAGYDSARCRSY